MLLGMPNARSVHVLHNHPGQCFRVDRGHIWSDHGPKDSAVRIVQLPSGRWILTRVEMRFGAEGMQDQRIPGEYESEVEAEAAARELTAEIKGRQHQGSEQRRSKPRAPGIRRGRGNPGLRRAQTNGQEIHEDHDENA